MSPVVRKVIEVSIRCGDQTTSKALSDIVACVGLQLRSSVAVMVDDDRGLKNDRVGNGGYTSGGVIGVCAHVLIGIDILDEGVEGRIYRPAGIQVHKTTARQGCFSIVGDALQQGEVLCIAGRAVNEDTINMDIAGGILIPRLVDIDVGLHAG